MNNKRKPIDSIGYATKPAQLNEVIEAARKHSSYTGSQMEDGTAHSMICGICPHDDFLYAAPLYLPVMERLQGKLIILIGVLHNTGLAHDDVRLILDEFDAWSGPHGDLSCDVECRTYLESSLGEERCYLDSGIHAREHSLEGFIPFIQYFSPHSMILPIIVPPMSWEQIKSAADNLAGAVADYCAAKDLVLGDDIQIVISNDGTHYGDQGWGGSGFAPFGCDRSGYEKAKETDLGLVRNYLTGVISDANLEQFLYSVTDRDNILKYRITWCGRFSVPFGLAFSARLCRRTHDEPLTGWLFNYGTSVEMGVLDACQIGLGVNAPATENHWVSYPSLGYYCS